MKQPTLLTCEFLLHLTWKSPEAKAMKQNQMFLPPPKNKWNTTLLSTPLGSYYEPCIALSMHHYGLFQMAR